MKLKPNIEFKGRQIITRNYCPKCGFTFHPSFKDNNMHTIDEEVWENYCPICGCEIDKTDLNDRITNVMNTGKDDLTDDILGN
jgi:predicted RNA-binding Zn-ribbon protein involved in translation (DUF1610 family)